jgi:hypothetical protein
MKGWSLRVGAVVKTVDWKRVADGIGEIRDPSCCAVQEQVVRSSNLRQTPSERKKISMSLHIYVVRKTYSNGVLSGMPTSVQNLLVEVQGVQLHGIPQISRPCSAILGTILSRNGTSDLLGFESRLVRLQDDVAQCVGVIYAEVIVVGASKDMSGGL